MTCDLCPKPAIARGWCPAHYRKWRLHGDPLGGRNHYPFPESLLRRLRFMPPTAMPTGCIEFTGGTDDKGYGQMKRDGRDCRAHRVAYEWLVGPIPDGLQLDHLCMVRACVNPAHLEPVTNEENQRRAAAYKTECPQGHPYDEVNTYVRPDGARRCRACRRQEVT